jgi:hypothetical protein
MLTSEKVATLGGIDLRGYLSDLAVSLTVSILCLIVLTWSRSRLARAGLAAFGVSWGFLNVANYEHVKVLDAPIEAAYAAFLGDSTFVEGSALSVSHPAAAILLLALPGLGLWWGSTAELTSRALQVVGASTVACWVTVLLWPVSLDTAPWRGSHFVHAMVSRTGPAQSRPEHGPGRLQASNLDGEPLLPLEPRHHNVLLVMIEGISGGYLPSQAKAQGFAPTDLMPELERVYGEAFSVPGFIANQRQTNRGEYAILCGDYPKLAGDTAKMSEYVQENGPPCLPAVLRDAGYTTAYLQSAPLGFMLKDQFMVKAGFETIHGAEYFSEGYARNEWGVDDRAFFEQSVDALERMDRAGKPWFAALLTVGTHHPFIVPEDFDGGEGSPHEQSVRYADRALVVLLERLEAAGLLDDTLVILTSDESAAVDQGGDDLARSLSHNWGIFAALVPGGAGAGVRQPQPYAQSDIALSIVDYLGRPELAHNFGGRSVFRSYAEPRTIWFGNAYTHRVYELGADSTLLACDEAVEECKSHVLEHQDLMAPRGEDGAPPPERIERARQAVEDSLARPASPPASVTVDLISPDSTFPIRSKGRVEIIFGGQFFTLAPGRAVELELQLEVEGEGAIVDVTHDLAGRGREVLVRPPIGPLESGDRVDLAYEFRSEKDLYDVGASLWAEKLAGKDASLSVTRARVTLRDGDVPKLPATEYRSFEIHRMGTGWKVGLSDLATNECAILAEGRATANDCEEKAVVFGPYRIAPRGSTLRASFDVAGSTSVGTLFVDVVSDKGQRVHHEGQAVSLRPGERATVEAKWKMDAPASDMEARLRWKPDAERGGFVVESGQVELEYPTSPVQPRD